MAPASPAVTTPAQAAHYKRPRSAAVTWLAAVPQQPLPMSQASADMNCSRQRYSDTRHIGTCCAFSLCFWSVCGLVSGCTFCQRSCSSACSWSGSFCASLCHEPSPFPSPPPHAVSSSPAPPFPAPSLSLSLPALVSLFLTSRHGQALLFFSVTSPSNKRSQR